MGSGEAYKQNNLLFKMVLHAQDINWSGQECDLEEILWDEAYGENLHADIPLEKQDRDFMLYSHEELVVRDIRQKLKIIAELVEHSEEYRNQLFPQPQKVLETFFRAYFSGLNDSYLTRFVSSDLPREKYVPTEVLVDLLDQKVFSYLGEKLQIRNLVIKLANEELKKRNSATIVTEFSIPDEYYTDWVSVAIRRLTHGKTVWGYLNGVLEKYHAGLIEELRNNIKEKKGNPQDWDKLFEDLFIGIKQEINSQDIADEVLREDLALIDTAINFLHGRNQNQVINLDEVLINIYKNSISIITPNIQGETLGKISGSEYDLLSAFVNIFNNFLAVKNQQFENNEISLEELSETLIAGKGFIINKRIEKNFAIIEFQDNLGGIPEEYLVPGKYKFNGKHYPKIFDYGISGRNGGTGIGLAETLFVIMTHGGDIDIISKPGKGTTFVVKLPLNSNIGTNTLSDGQADVFFKSINQKSQDFVFPQSVLQSI